MPGSVLDYSGWRPNPAALKMSGVVGVVRYPYLGPGTEWKACSKPEYQGLEDAGLSVAFTPELSKTTWLEPGRKGLTVGAMARQWVHDLGWPDSRPLHFAVDMNVAPGQLNQALDYLHDCALGGGCGPQSSYGETMVGDAAVALGICVNHWRAAAVAWDPTASRSASLFQMTTKSYPQFDPSLYDENVILKPDWGQHPAPNGEIMVAPYSLWRDQSNIVWRVGADFNSRVRVTTQDQINWNLALLVLGGFKDQAVVNETGGDVTKVAWLNAIPDAGISNVSAQEASTIAVAVGNEQAKRWGNG